MSIYQDLLNAVEDGKKFKVDLVNKSLWIDRKLTIQEGVIIDEQNQSKELINRLDLKCINWIYPLNEYPWKWVEFLYDTYKHSVPSENNQRSYFKALSVDELNDNELAYNAERNYMQAILEGYILLSSLQGWLKWEHGDHWFWKAEDKDLVVLKNWIE